MNMETSTGGMENSFVLFLEWHKKTALPQIDNVQLFLQTFKEIN